MRGTGITQAVYAVGIDLAWSPKNGTGIAVAERGTSGWILRDAVGSMGSNAEIVGYLEEAVGPAPAILSIDAPLVVPHDRASRAGDRAIASAFGPMKAAVYPATKNRLGSYGGRRIWDLVRDLKEAGFHHDCAVVPGKEVRQFFETYPHAATVALFHLPRILNYKAKQGRSYEERWGAFRELHRHLRSLKTFDPSLKGVDHFLRPRLAGIRGKALKAYEDRIDGILCAYIAAYYWTWGTDRCAIFGDLNGGYIVTPMDLRVAARLPRDSAVVTYMGSRGPA